MYQPIISVIRKEWQTELENNIFKAIREYAIDVDKDELLKALRYDRGQYEKGYADGIREAQTEWISVDERLPEESGQYLTWHNFYYGIHEYSVEKQGWNITHCEDRSTEIKTVTHWRPLPEAPMMKGGEEESDE